MAKMCRQTATEKEARPVEPRLYGRYAQPQRFGDLAIQISLQVAQDDDRLVHRLELLEGLLEEPLKLPLVGAVVIHGGLGPVGDGSHKVVAVRWKLGEIV